MRVPEHDDCGGGRRSKWRCRVAVLHVWRRVLRRWEPPSSSRDVKITTGSKLKIPNTKAGDEDQQKKGFVRLSVEIILCAHCSSALTDELRNERHTKTKPKLKLVSDRARRVTRVEYLGGGTLFESYLTLKTLLVNSQTV